MQAYANNYTGNAKINRLVFISEKTADAGLALSALRIAAEELKKVNVFMGRPVLNNDREDFRGLSHAYDCGRGRIPPGMRRYCRG